MLKQQDVLVLVKLLALDLRSEKWQYSSLSKSLGLSKSETHGAVSRLCFAQLVRDKKQKHKPIRSNTLEFLIHGAKYCFPAKLGSMTRGMPTSYAAPPLNQHFSTDEHEPIPVWPDHEGAVRGIELSPLYDTVPQAAAQDSELYEILSLFDAIRVGLARERKIAKDILKKLKD